MNRQATQFLSERVSKVKWRDIESAAEPSSIKAARRLIQQYEQARAKELSARRDKCAAESTKVRELIYAGEYEAALQAVIKLEAMKF